MLLNGINSFAKVEKIPTVPMKKTLRRFRRLEVLSCFDHDFVNFIQNMPMFQTVSLSKITYSTDSMSHFN